MRALFLARDDGHFDLFEPGGFKKLMELHFAKAEPVIRVKLASALETVAEQIQDHDPAALSQDAVSAGDRALGMDRVMQGLAENRKIDRAFSDRRIFDVAQAIFEVREAVP